MSSDYVKADCDDQLPVPDGFDNTNEQDDPRFLHVKSEATKKYLTEQWEEMFQQRSARDARAMNFQRQIQSLSGREKKKAEKRFIQTESSLSRLNRMRLSPKDFEKIKLIGRGASGEIWLVRCIAQVPGETSEYYAMKIVNKVNVIVNDQTDSVKSERKVLATIDNPWIVKLAFSFQDPVNLYFVLEFVQGGDLFSLLSRLTVFDEQTAKFYIAEIALAIDSVHKLGFVHRDIKPDNILITTKGHVKLADFGLSTQFEKRDTQFLRVLEELRTILLGETEYQPQTIASERPCTMVGTINYIAPEVLAEEQYDSRCDWWSLGIIAYEMLYGVTPFESKTSTETALKVVRWKKNLNFPSVPKLSAEAIDFMKNLITTAPERLTFQGIQNHPFFADIDWNGLELQQAPIIPQVSGPEDLSAFENVDDHILSTCSSMSNVADKKKMKYAFLGFTYMRPRKHVRSVDIDFSPADED